MCIRHFQVHTSVREHVSKQTASATKCLLVLIVCFCVQSVCVRTLHTIFQPHLLLEYTDTAKGCGKTSKTGKTNVTN